MTHPPPETSLALLAVVLGAVFGEAAILTALSDHEEPSSVEQFLIIWSIAGSLLLITVEFARGPVVALIDYAPDWLRVVGRLALALVVLAILAVMIWPPDSIGPVIAIAVLVLVIAPGFIGMIRVIRSWRDRDRGDDDDDD